jgi:outer membrane protein OmpA-like peptidoglycan-associated protein
MNNKKLFKMKHILLTILFSSTFFAANATETWRVYVTTFTTKNEDFKAVSKEISDDFQIVLETCNERFQVMDRREYVSWVEESSADVVSNSKILLQLQDLEYLVFGEVFYNGLKNCYTIEYGFEEVNTGSVLFVDNLVFKTLEELQNHEKRYAAIAKRLTLEFDLCQVDEKKSKAKMVEIKSSLKHQLRDVDGDSVPDLIDEEPNTPKGSLVNSKGVAYTKDELDMEAISAKPAPTDSAEIVNQKNNEMEKMLRQMMPEMPTILFMSNTNRVEEENYTQLHQVAKVMEMYPAIKLIVTGNTENTTNTLAYQRAYNTITYLIDHYDIPQKRLILAYGKSESKDNHTVSFEVTLKEDLKDMNEPSF